MIKEKTLFYEETNLKDTEIGKIPGDWEVVKIKNTISELIKGKKPKSKNQTNNLIPYLTTEYLRSKKIDKKVNLDNEKYIVKENDIILLWDGSNAGEFFKGKYGYLSSTTVKLVLKDNLEKEYFFYFAKFKIENILKSLTRGTGIPHVDKNVLLNLELPIPFLKEQKAIAKVLKDFDDLLEIIDKQIEKFETIKKGLINEYFTKGIFKHEKFKDTEIGRIPEDWEVVKLKDIFNVKTGTTPSTKIKEYWENGTENWFTPEDFNKGKSGMFLRSSKRKITNKAIKEKNLNVLKEGSILISTRAPVGYVALLKEKGTFNQGCKGLEAKKNVNNLFYVYYLFSNKKKLEELSGGSTFKELSKSALENLKIPLLPLEEQKAIAERLKNIDELIETKQKEREHLEKAKKKVMDLLLTGKVRISLNKFGG